MLDSFFIFLYIVCVQAPCEVAPDPISSENNCEIFIPVVLNRLLCFSFNFVGLCLSGLTIYGRREVCELRVSLSKFVQLAQCDIREFLSTRWKLKERSLRENQRTHLKSKTGWVGNPWEVDNVKQLLRAGSHKSNSKRMVYHW